MFVECGKSNEFFLNSANLICRSTDISNYFRESLGIRDNESRLYLFWPNVNISKLFWPMLIYLNYFDRMFMCPVLVV